MSNPRSPVIRPNESPGDRWAMIRATTAQALELAPAERGAYIERASAGDAALSESVRELVRACESADRSDDFLVQDAATFAAPMFGSAQETSTSIGARAVADAATTVNRSAVEVALRDALAGRYDVQREIGRGGMATVYLARDLRHDRAVALKVLDPALSAAVSSERFLREIHLTAGLTHPNILPLHDSGDTASAIAADAPRLLYYVMPYVAGESLRQRLLRECPLATATAVRLLREVASALAYAHRQGVVHRDIKPGNILLADEHALVADFGIARALRRAQEAAEAAAVGDITVTSVDGNNTLTQSHASLGTPAYMAPEQITGDSSADHRVDLYALGIVAYEALAGVHPFGPRSAQALLSAQLQEEPVPLASRRADLPSALCSLIMRLLAKDPAARPQSADEVVAALDTILFNAPEHGRSASVGSARVSRTRMLVLSSAAAVVVTAIAIVTARNPFASLARAPRDSIGAPRVQSGARAIASAAARSSVAVLPFVSSGGGESSQSFADGLTEDLISALSRVPGLRVPGRTSVFALKGKSLELRTIADTLGVSTVLEGSVRRAGERLKVDVRLLSAADGAVLWSETYDRRMRDVFAVQEEIARAIVTALPVHRPDSATLVPSSTGDVRAYDLYLRGRYNWAFRTREGLERAIVFFQQAIDRDPNYALAYQGMADAYMNLGNYGFLPLADALSRARVAADRAVVLGPDVAEAYASQGFVLASQRHFAAAEAALRRSIELRPNYIWAHHYYSLLLAMMGRVDDARAENVRATELDPISPPASAHGGIVACMAGDLREARRKLETTVALAPGFQLGLYYLGVVNAAEGRYAEAIRVLEQAHAGSPTFPGVQGALAYSYARAGRARAAEEVMREMAIAPDGSRARLNRALFDAMRGGMDQAFVVLDSLELDLPGLIELRADPLLAGLRRDARYDRLVRRLAAE